VAPKSAPEPDPHRRTHLYRAATPELWYSMAAIQNAGLALEWARNTLGASWHDVYEEAFALSPGAGGVVFLPYLSGERTPRFDADARGAWVGLGLEHGRGHLLRAALEGVAFALLEGLEALEEAGTTIPELRLAGGGTAEEPWQQLLADVLGRPLRVLPGGVAAVASARGAALLAGAAAGVYRSWEDILAPDPDLSVLPGGARGAYDLAYARYRELYPSLYG
jgi:xylulokinase